MKRIRNLTIIMAATAAALILSTGIGTALAYFTTYAEAEGGYKVSFSHREELEERVTDLTKEITISNSEKSQPVYVRARAFVGDRYTLAYTGGAGWTEGSDGWWYYNEALPAGGVTTGLTAAVSNLSEEDVKSGDELNIVVVYESTLVIYKYNETAGKYEAYADWDVIYDKGSSQS